MFDPRRFSRLGRWLRAGLLVALGLAAAPLNAVAQAPAVPLPPQGSPIPRIAPQAPQPTLPQLTPAPLPAANLPAANVAVTSVTVEGATAFPASALLALSGSLTGDHTSLRDIEAARRAILLRYRDGGFPFVVVAARVDKGGLLRFLITEGFIADIKLSGDVGPVGTLVLKFLKHLVGQRPVKNADIEYWLLLAQTIPGLQVQPIIQPSEREPGAFTLIAKVSHSKVSGSAAIDNAAFNQTGSGEALLTAGINSLTAWGERSEASFYLAGPNGRQVFGQASEQFFVGGSGLSVRLYAGKGDTLPCCDLAAINYDGKTSVVGGSVSYPLLLSRHQQLYVRGLFDALDTETLEVGSRASGDSLRTVRAEADYNLSDSILGTNMPGVSTAGLRVSKGLAGLGASSNGRPNAGRLNENVQFTKVDGEITRDQTLAYLPEGGPRVSLFGLFTGQASADIMPSAEQFYLGGLRYTRGFYVGQVSGDQAVAATAELRLSWDTVVDVFGTGPLALTPQVFAFYDWGETWQNQATDANHILRSFGIGVRSGFGPNVRADALLVQRVTRDLGSGTSAEPVNAFYARLVTLF